MAKEFLGEFEELVLTLVAALQDDAYGAAISDEIENKFKREVNLSAVHVTLYRLEDKGYLKSKLGGERKEGGGRRKRIYTVTNTGMATLRLRGGGPGTGTRQPWGRCSSQWSGLSPGRSPSMPWAFGSPGTSRVASRACRAGSG